MDNKDKIITVTGRKGTGKNYLIENEIKLNIHTGITGKEKESKYSIFTGMKGIGKSDYIENKFKDFLKIETPNKNRQDKSITEQILEARKVNDKILLKTHVNYLKNKYNINNIIKSRYNFDITIVIDDIGKQLSINKKSFNNNTFSKFNLKETDVYKLIKKN